MPSVSTAPIAWKTVTGVKTGDRPLMVWIADPALDAAAEHRAFDDTDVRLASNAFRRARISPSDARADSILAGYAPLAPVLIVFTPDLSRASFSYGASLEPRSVLGALRTSAATSLRLDLDGAVARARTLLAEEKTLSDERASLATASASETEAARRRALLGAIDGRLAAIRTEVDGLFRSHAS